MSTSYVIRGGVAAAPPSRTGGHAKGSTKYQDIITAAQGLPPERPWLEVSFSSSLDRNRVVLGLWEHRKRNNVPIEIVQRELSMFVRYLHSTEGAQ